MKRLLLLLAVVLMLIGCQSKLDLITVNDDIPSKKTTHVDEVLSGLTGAIQNSDLETFISLCVPGTEEFNTLYFNEFINNGRLFIDFFLEKNFEKENRYYITDITRKGESTPYASEGYEFRIPTVENAEGSRYIYIVEGEYNNFDILLTVVLAEQEGDFKIERFTLGDIRPYDESVVTLINKADALEHDNKLISAWQFNELAAQFVSPSPYVYFTDDERISRNMERVAATISDELTFPIDVEMNDDTYVKLYAIASNKYEDGFYCRVIYVSNIPENQANDEMIKEEARRLHVKASEVLNGLGEGFEGNILYTAYFEEPLDQGKDYTTVTVDLKE